VWQQGILPLTFPAAIDDHDDYDYDDDHADGVLFTITSERNTESGIHYSFGEGCL
jgi:hypothetical protein